VREAWTAASGGPGDNGKVVSTCSASCVAESSMDAATVDDGAAVATEDAPVPVRPRPSFVDDGGWGGNAAEPCPRVAALAADTSGDGCIREMYTFCAAWICTFLGLRYAWMLEGGTRTCAPFAVPVGKGDGAVSA
jgi:hypothetical protein